MAEMRQGKTSTPSFLTEPELIGLMDANGIGTDATIAEHIKKLQDREYIFAIPKIGIRLISELVPSNLGLGLIEGYNSMEFEKNLSKPFLRKETEKNMQDICDGKKNKEDVIQLSLNEYRSVYFKATQQKGKLLESVIHQLNATV